MFIFLACVGENSQEGTENNDTLQENLSSMKSIVQESIAIAEAQPLLIEDQ